MYSNIVAGIARTDSNGSVFFLCNDANIKMDSYESKAIVTMNHNQKQMLFDNCNGSSVTASWQTHPKKWKYKEGA